MRASWPGRHGYKKIKKEENELCECSPPLDLYAHKMFDETPVNEIGKSFEGSVSPEMD